jgi:hypothetical protein
MEGKMSRRIQQSLKPPKAGQSPNWEKTSQLPNWAKTLLLSIGIAIFAGIVVNMVIDPIKNFLKTVWDLIKIISNWFVAHVIQQNLWPYGVLSIVIIVLTVLLLYTRHDRDVKSNALHMTNKILVLDDSVLRMLPICTTNKSHERKPILKGVLRQIIMVFGGPVERAAILLEDPDKLSHLTCQAHYHMTDDDIQSMQCDMGSTSQIQHNKGTIAGNAFLTGQILVAHLENGHWVCQTHTQQIRFEETHPSGPYQSFVNIPIPSSNSSTNTLPYKGILHLESRSKDTFDPNEYNDSNAIETLLKGLARRVAALIEDTNITTDKQEDSSNDS